MLQIINGVTALIVNIITGFIYCWQVGFASATSFDVGITSRQMPKTSKTASFLDAFLKLVTA